MIITSKIKAILKINFLKTCLVFSGLFLIYDVSENAYAVCILFACAISSYFLAFLISRKESSFRLSLGQLIVPLIFVLIVILNITGLVGTLTGSTNNQANASLLLGAPFYFLSAAAFISDICLKKQSLPNLLDYFVYLCLPFKLLAGPLEPPRLLNQIKNWSPRFTWWKFGIAWPWIVLGTFMKFVIANRLEPSLNISFTSPLTSLITAAIFELKFYFDFAGYSFMGYGFALLCGFKINQNFRHPFFAPNVLIFWHRWHISLGEFLRIYILAPNLRHFSTRSQKLIFASSIFLVSALWHGGTGNYVLWGLFHGGVYFVYVNYFKKKNITPFIGFILMVLFFIFGRFIAIDSNFERLLEKIYELMNLPFVFTYHNPLYEIENKFKGINFVALVAVFLFLILEAYSLKLYSIKRSYHFFRKPLISFFLLMVVLFCGVSNHNLLYARI